MLDIERTSEQHAAFGVFGFADKALRRQSRSEDEDAEHSCDHSEARRHSLSRSAPEANRWPPP